MTKVKNRFADTIKVRLINGDSLDFEKQSMPWFIEFKTYFLEIVSNLQPKTVKHDNGNHEMLIKRHYIPLIQIKEVIIIDSNLNR